MSSSYLISLVVPVYGVEKYIGKFAESVLSQDCPDIQYVFVDDGSKDRSMDILCSLIDSRYSALKDDIVIVRKQNGGLPLARKTGVAHATGEYVLFADSDDWLEAGALRKISDKIAVTGADIVYFDLVKEYGDHVSYKRERSYDASSKKDFIINMFNYRSHGYTVTKCFRRSLYVDNDIFTPPYGMHEDICLMSQIIFHARSFAHIEEPLYHYRKDNDASFCSQDRKTRHVSSDRNLLALYGHFRDDVGNSPIADVWGGILMRAAWHSIIHRQDYYAVYPYLAGDIAKAPMSFRYRIGIAGQLFVKFYSELYRLCKR